MLAGVIYYLFICVFMTYFDMMLFVFGYMFAYFHICSSSQATQAFFLDATAEEDAEGTAEEAASWLYEESPTCA